MSKEEMRLWCKKYERIFFPPLYIPYKGKRLISSAWERQTDKSGLSPSHTPHRQAVVVSLACMYTLSTQNTRCQTRTVHPTQHLGLALTWMPEAIQATRPRSSPALRHPGLICT